MRARTTGTSFQVALALSFIATLFLSSPSPAQTWKKVYGPFGEDIEGMLADRSGHVFGGSDTGSWASSNDGDTWYRDSSGMTAPDQFCYVEMQSGLLLAGTEDGGIFRSSDFGVHWSACSNGIGDTASVKGLICTKKQELFASIPLHGIFYSSDSGNSWSARNTGLPSLDVLPLTLAPNGDIYVGLTGAIARSTDDGLHWQSVYTLDASDEVLGLGADSSGTIFATTFHARVLLSNDESNTWKDIGPTKHDAVECIAVQGNQLFIGTYGSGVYRSRDIGNTWTPISDGLTGNDLYVFSEAITPNGYLFAGTLSASIFRTALPLSSVKEIREQQNSALSVRYDRSDRLKVTLHSAQDGNIELSIVDVAGREISRIYSGFERMGEHAFSVDRKGFAHSAAFVVLRTQEGNYATPVEF